ncbi:MAG: asparagine synthase (glutamine-hydrolyzing) [Alphaproteobacteria bacterium]
MCGIAGIIGGSEKGEALARTVARMKSTLLLRGPDGEGMFFDHDAAQPVGIAHRRLAIIDPAAGQQPMRLEEAGLTLAFNGAIYNHVELRATLAAKGHVFRTHSDTEVILHAYREWGTGCLAQFNGMFAFALWDAQRSRLFCARDRIGIKPFYYALTGGRFLFASEIKAILAASDKPAEMNPEGLADYVAFQFMTGDKTLFAGVNRLEPAQFLLLDVGKKLDLRVETYWQPDYTIDESLTEERAVEELRALLKDAVRLQLRADVPVGAYLSGGMDSSAIVGMATAQLNGAPFKTFTGAFREGAGFDETPYAHEVATACGAEQYDIYIRGEDFASTMPELIYALDQPAAGPGLYPQYFVSKFAAQQVKVCLGGQGGDELFIGYARYLAAMLEHCLKGAIMGGGDGEVALADITASLPMLRDYRPMLQGLWKDGLFGSDESRYYALIERSDAPHLLARDALPKNYHPVDSFRRIFDSPNTDSFINRMLHFDLKASLPALLTVEDRVSMAASLESRVPLLDHRIVEFMNRVPVKVKFAGGEMKHLFRRAVEPYVPPRILNRTDKMGFPVPLDQWVKGIAREFVADTLLSRRARERGLYRPEEVEKAISGQAKFSRVTWGLLCLELWQREFIDGACRARLPKAA